LLAFPGEESELLRHYSLALTTSRSFVGVAAITTVWGLRSNSVTYAFPVGCSPLDEVPYPPILGMAAAQLKVPTGAWHFYAEHRETRREHLLELREQWSNSDFRLSRTATTDNSRRKLSP
jgi:hypothetical protein